MGKSYRAWNPEQTFLLPPSLRDWLPPDHLAYFILEVVGELDLSGIERVVQSRDARGERPYHPQMMVALLVYAYSVGVYSSRRIERATSEDIAFRVLTGNSQPHFTTINEFRRRHRACLASLFSQILVLCRGAGLVKLGHVAIDGTKVRASASKHKAMSYKRMGEEEKRLQAEVDQMLSEADAVDEAEDKLYGKGKRAWEMPEELKTREQRLARIREAKAALEREARENRATQLREQAAGMEASAAQEPREAVRSRLRGNAAMRKAKANELSLPFDDDDDDPDDASGSSPTELPRHRTKFNAKGEPDPQAQRNFTDPDSRLMVGRDGYIQAYNCQAAVDEEHQIIVACGVTNQPPDNGNLTPMVNRIVENCGEAPQEVTADSGYWHPDAPEQVAKVGSKALIATERIKHGAAGPPTAQGPPPEDLSAREQMKHRLNTEQGRATYSKRKSTVEPVFGQTKAARGYRSVSFRGLWSVDKEWSLVCACHNLLKLYRRSWRAAVA